jgi:hypothetical protein
VRVGGQQKPLAAPYAGPYQVMAAGAKNFTIQVGQRQEVIFVDCLKAHTGVPARCLLQRLPLVSALSRNWALQRSSLLHIEASDWGGPFIYALYMFYCHARKTINLSLHDCRWKKSTKPSESTMRQISFRNKSVVL